MHFDALLVHVGWYCWYEHPGVQPRLAQGAMERNHAIGAINIETHDYMVTIND